MSAKAVTLTVKGASKENDSFARHPFYDSVKTIEMFNMSFFFFATAIPTWKLQFPDKSVRSTDKHC